MKLLLLSLSYKAEVSEVAIFVVVMQLHVFLSPTWRLFNLLSCPQLQSLMSPLKWFASGKHFTRRCWGWHPCTAWAGWAQSLRKPYMEHHLTTWPVMLWCCSPWHPFSTDKRLVAEDGPSRCRRPSCRVAHGHHYTLPSIQFCPECTQQRSTSLHQSPAHTWQWQNAITKLSPIMVASCNLSSIFADSRKFPVSSVPPPITSHLWFDRRSRASGWGEEEDSLRFITFAKSGEASRLDNALNKYDGFTPFYLHYFPPPSW